MADSPHHVSPNNFTKVCRFLLRIQLKGEARPLFGSKGTSKFPTKAADVLTILLWHATIFILIGIGMSHLSLLGIGAFDNLLRKAFPALAELAYLPTASSSIGFVPSTINAVLCFMLQVAAVLYVIVFCVDKIDVCECCNLSRLDEVLGQIRFCEEYPCAFSVRDWLLRLYADVKKEMGRGETDESEVDNALGFAHHDHGDDEEGEEWDDEEENEGMIFLAETDDEDVFSDALQG